MSAPWTPGPWNQIVKLTGFTAVGGKTLIARVFSTAFRDAENEKANAQLVSAAPDLYAALESIQWGNDEIGNDDEVYHLCPECDRSEVRGHQADCSVGNALAKARGEA